MIIFFRGGGRIVSEQFGKISLNHEEQYSSVKSLVYIYILPCLNVKLNITSSRTFRNCNYIV